MKDTMVDNLNVKSQEVLITPDQLKQRLPVSEEIAQHTAKHREVIRNILDRKDHRMFVVVGPCSIHDVDAALDYANRLKILAKELEDTLYIVMRVYFEKPRTTVGWKGLINDPYLNDTFQIHDGLYIGRKLLLDIAGMGLPTSTEALDPISPQYIHDCISWSAIGARTTESQTHREMASGLSSAVGFKNGTDGGLAVAVNAIQSATNPHCFLGINGEGQVTVIHTKGNRHTHMVLRGGSQGSNYDSVNIAVCEEELKANGLANTIVVDCSHANSSKKPELQPLVIDNVANQVIEGNLSIVGVMAESNIHAGNQSIPSDLTQLKYGVSVTDGCIDWETTEKTLRSMRAKLKDVLPKRLAKE